MRPALLVTLPQVWGVRNVLRSGLYTRLSRDFRVLLGVPPEGIDTLAGEGIPRRDLFPLERYRPPRALRLLLTLLKEAHRERAATDSDRILGGWHARGRAAGAKERLLRSAARLFLKEKAFSFLAALERERYEAWIPRQVHALLDRERPVMGLSTEWFLGLEWPVHRALQARGIPTATQILSFDNLTSRGWLPFSGFDLFLVWQERMRQELGTFYGVPPSKVTVTGTPQFDFHVRDVWSRERTARALGLDPARRWAVYCANHRDLTPSEPALVASLLERFAQDETLGGLQWVLRLHPLEDYARWDALRQRYPRLAVSIPWRQAPGSAVWGTPSRDELALFGNLLRHGDAMLAMASTTVLDACVVDTPAVCVGFNDAAPAAESAFYLDAHYSHHYEPIARSGAAPVAADFEALRAHLREAVTRPLGRREARRRLVESLCGPVDGGAAERIAAALRDRVGLAADPAVPALALSRAGKS